MAGIQDPRSKASLGAKRGDKSDPEPLVQSWDCLVRRVPNYLETLWMSQEVPGQISYQDIAFRKFQTICPKLGGSPKVFLTWCAEVVAGFLEVLPWPPLK